MPLIYILGFYLPLEEFILKWLPVSDQAYLMLRQLIDLIVFSMFALLVLKRLFTGRSVPVIGRGCDVLLFLFLACAALTSLLNHADVALSIANIKALLRYILLIYIILLLDPTEKQIIRLLRWIGAAIIGQLFIGIFQYAGGFAARDFLAARHVSDNVAGIATDFTGDRFEDINDLMGTMGNTIAFGMFLLVGISMWLVSHRLGRLRYWLGFFLLFIPIYLTGSRSVVLSALFLLLVNYGLVFNFTKLARKILLLVPLVIPFLFLSDYLIDTENHKSFSYIFTPDYIQEALNQRLGILVYLGPHISFSSHSLLGYSPDKFIFIDFVHAHLKMVPQILVDVLEYVIEDVYWVALFIYYGWVGLIIWGLFLFQIWKKLTFIREQFISPTLMHLSSTALLLLIVSIPLNFLNQAFEVRAFSFYLWLICGLTLAFYRRVQRDMDDII